MDSTPPSQRGAIGVASPITTSRPHRRSRRWHYTNDDEVAETSLLDVLAWTLSTLALVSFLLVLWTVLSGKPLPGKPGWPLALLVVSATAATMASLSRQLPGQNVLLAAAGIAVIGGLAHGVGARTALPFGPFVVMETAGPKLFNSLAWPMPMIWIIAVLNARGVGRLILRPWRKLRNYGFWLIALTAALVVLFDLALEPFATVATPCWRWMPTKFPYTWHGAPLVNFPVWLFVTVLILAFTTPALINKQSRSRKQPPDYHPLAVWLLVFTLFAACAIQSRLWSVAALSVATGLLTLVLAVRGARW